MLKAVGRRSVNALILFALLVALGCTWQRISPAPLYVRERPIPLRVGVVLAEDRTSEYHGLIILDSWKQVPLFESVTWPYREGDSVDAVLHLSVSGAWKHEETGVALTKGFLIGLSYGLLSPVLGPSVTGTHDIVTTITIKGSTEERKYSAHVETVAEWGILADREKVSRKMDEVHYKKMAGELAQKIMADRAVLMKAAGK